MPCCLFSFAQYEQCPLSQAVFCFQKGMQDPNVEVVSLCQTGLLACDCVLRPRHPTFRNPPAKSLEEDGKNSSQAVQGKASV